MTYPKNVIHFVCKTGFITKTLWEDFFFQHRKRSWTYQSWNNLVTQGYFLPYPNRYWKDVLVLNPRSEKVRQIVKEFGSVTHPGVHQIVHDEAVYRGILGLSQKGLIHDWSSEAELKTFMSHEYQMVVQGDKTKYPDILASINSHKKTLQVAIEMERTTKSLNRYSQILTAYSCMQGLDAILWVVSSHTLENQLRAIMSELYFPTDEISVSFVSEAQWIKSPESALQAITKHRTK